MPTRFNRPSSRAPRPDAETLAVTALGWIAGDAEQISRFLALTGADVSDLRQAAGEPGFLAGVLDFLMGHEPTLMDFCAAHAVEPEDVAQAWQKLSGRFLDSGQI
ncbi:hypothetical protein BJF92_23255 [Rhizobium rhizosphaerae]|uniref:DUF3572 family protein n=1 Tax=Xaviernesmea rhizosphaerae TaxID=1672749 RepID=A0A1Q9AJL0_9HYPH|nr:DUF3572 domain-containing protein [Xaviernesmea rhizosphaerae]OLP55460.1 hypothetical protein BJF92_23255 [Xaviernesmea rhizosphaerae]OQP85561.1 hypothetical protein BTR14_15355 [Xaviernesmea rhizosphaerae]